MLLLDVKVIKGRWEAYKICVVDDNLVIAGSDKRGTINGIYEISQRIGVSPWYWMADAPVIHKDEVWYNDDNGNDYGRSSILPWMLPCDNCRI